MPRENKETFEADCPCCKAKLTLDRDLGVVLSHVPPPKPPPSIDLDDTARLLRAARPMPWKQNFALLWKPKNRRKMFSRENLQKA